MLAAVPAAQAPAGRWDPALVDLLRLLPVQDGGRVKPFDTFVSFLLLRLHGKRSLSIPDDPRFGSRAGARLGAMEWALDVLFHKDLAARYPVFQVQTTDVLDALGVPHEGKRKRDLYALADLLPGTERLRQLAGEVARLEERERTVVQAQLLHLHTNLAEYERFARGLDFARARFAVGGSTLLRGRFAGRSEVRFSEILPHGKEIAERYSSLAQAGTAQAEMDELRRILQSIDSVVDGGGLPSWLPPPEPEEARWLDLQELVLRGVLHPHGRDYSAQFALLARWEALVDAAEDSVALQREAAALHADLHALAGAGREYRKIEAEVAFYRADYFFKALIGYVLAFVLAAVTWLRPRGRWLPKVVGITVLASTAVLATGIAVRCALRERPPVTTLYETTLFVSAVLAIVAMVLELMYRRRVAISAGALLGAAGVYLAFSYETADAQDTMPTLIAVLDTNFWLATHVTTVTIGYAAGLLAGAIAHVYVLGRLLGLRRGDAAFYGGLGRMVYGVLCFGLLFSIVGTILGGIWANESWGRFWGWDPKENGALLIVLWEVLVLHGRIGGYLRDRGICTAAIAGNVVVAFSWWGVNLLGVGLHSYGFTSGVQRGLYGFYVLESAMVVVAVLTWLREGATSRRSAAVPVRAAGDLLAGGAANDGAPGRA